jgi:hypothetical protein
LRKDTFIEELADKIDKTKPIVIAADVKGHFNVMVLYQGEVYVIDSVTDE